MAVHDEDLLRQTDVARRLRVSERTVIRLRLAQALPPPIRIGRQIRWRPADIDHWVKSLPELTRS